MDAEAEEVKAAGGLFILGTERHEARRIDNQLRGRAGRQGDVGETVFYISFEDDLLRLFGGERLANMSLLNSFPDNEPISSGMFTKTVENAQRRKEGANFNGRENVLKYDNVVNEQRNDIYSKRDQIMAGLDISSNIATWRNRIIDRQLDTFCGGTREDWNLKGLKEYLEGNLYFPERDMDTNQPIDLYEDADSVETLRRRLQEAAARSAALVEEKLTPQHMRELERFVMLSSIDRYWMDHIDAMDDLRRGINLQAYAQHDPLQEYQIQGDELFRETIYALQEQTVFDCLRLFRTWAVNVLHLEEFVRAENARKAVAHKLKLSSVRVNDDRNRTESGKGVTVVKSKKIGPNEPCPCGSGKKYKKCCGQGK